MPKTVVVYNQAAVFAGPAPATGYHFITSDGVPNNDYDVLINNYSLLFPINRVTDVRYSFEAPRTNIRDLGNLSSIASPILSPPNINLSLSYYLMGLINESRFGFIFNHPSGDPYTGAPLYNDNVCPINGFVDRTYERSSDTAVRWPLTYRDCRNIFVAVRKDKLDVNDFDSSTTYKYDEIYVIGFGNCYPISYSTRGAVGELAGANIQFTCDNIVIYESGYNVAIPALSPQSGLPIPDKVFCVPTTYQGDNLPTVILPQNIFLTLKKSNGNNLSDIVANIEDAKIQSYDISFNLERDVMMGFGHKLALDKPIKFPVPVNVSFTMLLGDYEQGSIADLLNRDEKYDFDIKLHYSDGKIYSGCAIHYAFRNALFQNASFEHAIRQYQALTLAFSVEMDPRNTDAGFFISGQLGVAPSYWDMAYFLGAIMANPPSTGYLLTQNNEILALDRGDIKVFY